MAAEVGFFTAVSFGNQSTSCTQSLLETVDSYFYLGGRQAHVMPGYVQQEREAVHLREADASPCWVTALKVISYLTIAIPVVMMIAKAILRSIHTFYIMDAAQVDNIRQCQQFYAEKGILDEPRKPIQVEDLASLGLNLDEQAPLRLIERVDRASDGKRTIIWKSQVVTLREVVTEVIAYINEAIAGAPQQTTIQEQRYITLDLNAGNFLQYEKIGQPAKSVLTVQEQQQSWLYKILNALVQTGHLLSLDHTSNVNYYYIQA